MSTASTALDTQDPDSLEEPEQEPTDDPGDEPSLTDEAEPDEFEAAADADAAEKPDEESAEPDGRPRDAHGRFVSAEAAPTDPSQPIADAPPPAPAVPAEPAEPPPPFEFTVYGRKVVADGASVEADGSVRFSPDAWKRHVLPRLADPGRIQQREARLQQTIEGLKSEKSAKEQRAEKILQRMDALLTDRKALVDFVNNYEVAAPRLKLEIENELLKAERESLTRRTQETGERDVGERFSQQRRPAIENAVSQILDGIEGVDAKEAADFIDGLWDAGTPIFFKVVEGDNSGLDPAEDPIGVDMSRIAKLLTPMIERGKRTAAEKKAAAVKAANQKALGTKPAPKPPTAVSTKGSPVPGGEERKFKTSEEFNAYLAERYKVPSSSS